MQKTSFLPFCAAVLLLSIGVLTSAGKAWAGVFFAVFFFLLSFFKKNRRLFTFGVLSACLLAFFRVEASYRFIESFKEEGGITFTAAIHSKEKKPYGYRLLLVNEEGKKIIAYLPFTIAEPGMRVEASCLAEPLNISEYPQYHHYLASQGIYVICEQTEIKVIETEPNFSSEPFLYARVKIAKIIDRLWRTPVDALVTGLLLGTRESFSEQTLEDFRRAGVTHIIALSGFNITIVVLFFERLFIHLFIPKKIRFPLVLLAIALFTITVGAGASIFRAALMGCLVLISKYLARKASAYRLMILVGAFMVALNPLILLYDMGFQLSFLATFGLVFSADWFEEKLAFVTNAFEIRTSLATTLAASFPTLPLLVYQFSSLSLISPLANMFILPLIPWIMALGALAVALSPITDIFIHPILWLVSFFSEYVLKVSSFMAAFSWAYFPIENNLAWGLITLVLCFILSAKIIYDKKTASSRKPLSADGHNGLLESA